MTVVLIVRDRDRWSSRWPRWRSSASADRHAPRRRRSPVASAGGSCSRSSRRRSRGARSTPRCASPPPRTRRSSRCSSRACRSTCRSTRRCPASARSRIPLLEAIEQRATEAGVPVDARIERGRNQRHALRQTIAHERFDRIVIAAAAHGQPRLRRRRRRLAARQRPGRDRRAAPERRRSDRPVRPRSASGVAARLRDRGAARDGRSVV